MRLFVVGHTARGGGAETFLREMLPELAKQMPESTIHAMIAESRKQFYQNLGENFEYDTVDDEILDNPLLRLKFDIFDLVGKIRDFHPDLIFFASETFSPILSGLKKPVVILYHATLQFYMRPGEGESLVRLTYTRMSRNLSARMAKLIITVSHFEGAEIGMRYKKNRFKNRAVVYHGVNSTIFCPNDSSVSTPHTFQFPYVLCISDWHEHKRMPEMIDIYSKMVQYGIEEHLVIIGRIKSNIVHKEIEMKIYEHDLLDRVHLVPYVDNHEIPPIYRKASLYWTHSNCESFGMTPLEAMACGVPVFAPWREALPEVYGNSICFYNDYVESFDEIVRKAVQLLKDRQSISTYVARGLEISSRLTWQYSASQYKALFEREAFS